MNNKFGTKEINLKWVILFTLFILPFIPAGAGTKKVVICDDVSDPLTLDPHKQFTEKNHTILQQIYEGLVRYNPDGKIIPALAESWERLDPLTVRFHLRQGVKFHNGESFDSESVRYSIDRYLDPQTGFPAIGFVTSIASVTFVDAYTADLHTHFPDGLLLNRLAGFVLMVPAVGAKEKYPQSLADFPVGTGPFEFSNWIKGKKIELKMNANYWRKGYPKVDSLEFRFLPNPDQLEALLRGEVDLVTEMPGTMTLNVKQNRGTDVVKKTSFYTVAGIFNTSQKPLLDRKVRLAINYAVNREELIRYDVLGNGKIISTLTMPGETGHNPDLVPFPFDPDRAKRLLQEAGYPNGFELKTLVRAQGERTAKIIAKQLERIGVKITIRAVASDAEIIGAFQQGGWDMGFAALPDPMAHTFFVQSVLLHSKSPFSLHHDSDYDRRLEQMAMELDPLLQDKMGQSLDKYLQDEALCIFTYQRIKTYGVSRRIRFTPYISGMPYFDSLEIVEAGALQKK